MEPKQTNITVTVDTQAAAAGLERASLATNPHLARAMRRSADRVAQAADAARALADATRRAQQATIGMSAATRRARRRQAIAWGVLGLFGLGCLGVIGRVAYLMATGG